MAQAPGYDKLMGWTDAPIMPTPGAVGKIMQTMIAGSEKIQNTFNSISRDKITSIYFNCSIRSLMKLFLLFENQS